MAPRTRSMAAALAAPLPLPLPSPSPTSTVFSSLFDSDGHEAPSSASSWDSQPDHHWPIQHQPPPPSPAELFIGLCICVPGFLRPGPFSSAECVRFSLWGCGATIRNFWSYIITNPLNTLGVRYPSTRTFPSYWQILLDAIYWNLMLVVAILGMLLILALRLFLEVVLFAFTFLFLYLILMITADIIWHNLAFLANNINDFFTLPRSETTWLLDEYSANHVTNDQTNFQPGTFLLTDPKAALRGHSTEPPPSSQAQSETTLTLRGDRVVGVGRVLHHVCQITETYRRVCAEVPLNISVLYVPAAPVNSISSWGLMVNGQLGGELECFNKLVHDGPGGEFRKTSCHDSVRKTRILKLQTKRWRG